MQMKRAKYTKREAPEAASSEPIFTGEVAQAIGLRIYETKLPEWGAALQRAKQDRNWETVSSVLKEMLSFPFID